MSRTRLRTAGLTSTLDLSGKTITNFATTGNDDNASTTSLDRLYWSTAGDMLIIAQVWQQRLRTKSVKKGCNMEIAGYNEQWH